MQSRDERLALLHLDITILRQQLANIAERPGSDRNRQFLFRELLSNEITYRAISRKREQQLDTHAVGA